MTSPASIGVAAIQSQAAGGEAAKPVEPTKAQNEWNPKSGITHSSSQHQQPFTHISLSPSFDGGLAAAAICGGLQLPPCHGRVVVVASCCCLLATPTPRTSCDLRGRQPVAAELVPAATRTQAGRSSNQEAKNLRGALELRAAIPPRHQPISTCPNLNK
ncbi:hypothetical protein E2562_014306, partial [Oryza meyeriana var. granulata]